MNAAYKYNCEAENEIHISGYDRNNTKQLNTVLKEAKYHTLVRY